MLGGKHNWKWNHSFNWSYEGHLEAWSLPSRRVDTFVLWKVSFLFSPHSSTLAKWYTQSSHQRDICWCDKSKHGLGEGWSFAASEIRMVFVGRSDLTCLCALSYSFTFFIFCQLTQWLNICVWMSLLFPVLLESHKIPKTLQGNGGEFASVATFRVNQD